MAPTELPVAERREPAGYIAGVVGCVVGAAAATLVGGFLGAAYSDRFMPNAELEGLGPVVVGAAVGLWLGGVAGVLFGLKSARRRAAAPTAALVAAAIPAWAVVSFPSFLWLVQRLAGDDVPDVVALALPVLIMSIPPPLASRWLVLHNEKIRSSRAREENPS